MLLMLRCMRRALSTAMLMTLLGTATAQADALARGMAAYSRGDYNRTVRELTPLARRGNPRALALLGFLYEYGLGEPQAYPAAADLYTQAAIQADPFGQAMLGLMYDKGHGVPQSFVLAYKWLDLAAGHATGEQRDVFANLRNAVASKMSRNEIAEGQRLALSWAPAAPIGLTDPRLAHLNH
jgi:TPR repeat protein